MQFKINRTTYRISFTFFASLLLFLTTENYKMYLLVYGCALLHETVHLFFIYILCAPPKSVSLTIFGGNIVRESNTSVSLKKEFIINASAPLFNIFLSFFLFAVKSVIKNDTPDIQNLIEINFMLGCFNLLPYYNFDGGNALRNLLLMKLKEKTAEIILTTASVIVTILFSAVSVYVFFYHNNNISLIIISVYLLLMIIFKK